MKAIPGGIVAPSDVIGRDRLIERLWAALDVQCLVLTAERRMGKTTIIRKMEAEPMAGMRAVYLDVEQVSRVSELLERTAQAISAHLSASKKAGHWLTDLWSALGGLDVAGVLKLPEAKGLHWKTALERLLGGLAANADPRVVLVWDELPWALQKIARTEGDAVVVDLLDCLRGLRQTHPALRLVFTGSIGLHHVLTGLQDQGWIHSPVNDMRAVEVPPLAAADAVHLAAELLRGEQLAGCGATLTATAERIAVEVEDVPFYIQHVVASLADRGDPATPEAAEAVVAAALTDPEDPWKLEHYRGRLTSYYGPRAAAARAVLDRLAEFGPLRLEDLQAMLQTGLRPDNDTARAITGANPEPLRRLVKLMERDHYLTRDDSGRFGFRFRLIHRWWRLELGLGPLPADPAPDR